MNTKTLKYDPPKDKNQKPYWVPIVAKNKDYLIGFLDGVHIALDMLDASFIGLQIALGSDRLNDILPDGRRISNLSKTEFKNILTYLLMRHSFSRLIANL